MRLCKWQVSDSWQWSSAVQLSKGVVHFKHSAAGLDRIAAAIACGKKWRRDKCPICLGINDIWEHNLVIAPVCPYILINETRRTTHSSSRGVVGIGSNPISSFHDLGETEIPVLYIFCLYDLHEWQRRRGIISARFAPSFLNIKLAPSWLCHTALSMSML